MTVFPVPPREPLSRCNSGQNHLDPSRAMPYLRIPERLLHTYAHNPLTIGVYVACAADKAWSLVTSNVNAVPSVHPLPVLLWNTRMPAIYAASHAEGAIHDVKIILVGRPGVVIKYLRQCPDCRLQASLFLRPLSLRR